jgi:hypothetical protein
MGGAWNVEVVIDEDRAIYAAWGLGTANMWHLFNPTTQMQGWKEKGWLGDKVAESIRRRGAVQPVSRPNRTAAPSAGADDDDDVDGVSNVLGNKWQESGAFAVDGRGTVIWGTKALRADEIMDLDEAVGLWLCDESTHSYAAPPLHGAASSFPRGVGSLLSIKHWCFRTRTAQQVMAKLQITHTNTPETCHHHTSL